MHMSVHYHMYLPLQHLCQLATCVMCMCTYVHASVILHTSNLFFVFLRNGLQYSELDSMYTFQSNFNLSLISLGICTTPRLPT